METKSKRVKLSKIDKYVETQQAFGWEVVSQDDLRPNSTVVITMQRDPNTFENFGKVRSLEKQYNSLSRPYPILTVVLAVIGLASLGAYLFLKSTVIFAIAFLYIALTFFCMAVFALIVFFLLLIKRNKLLTAIKKEASNKFGSNSDWPTQRNVLEEGELTWALIQSAKE